LAGAHIEMRVRAGSKPAVRLRKLPLQAAFPQSAAHHAPAPREIECNRPHAEAVELSIELIKLTRRRLLYPLRVLKML
jgi:hypothetical protein